MTERAPAILFVCLGNICRSPMAEGAARAEAARLALPVEIDSAGTGNWHAGNAPDPRAQRMALANGVDISGQRARQVQAQDFERFTHIVAMDEDNLAALQRARPDGAAAELSLLLDHVPGRDSESVGDPYYGGPEGFRTVWADVTAGVAGLLAGLAAAR